MTVDALAFLGRSRFGLELDEQTLLDRARVAGVAVTVVSPPHPRDHDLTRANDEAAAAVDRSDGRLAALCRVDPWDAEESRALIRRAADSAAFHGLLLHPAEEHFRINDGRLRPIAEAAADAGLPIVVVTGTPWQSEATQVGEFAQWCTGVPVVMTNGGQYNISGLSQTDAEAALAFDNVHVHTNGVYREDFLQRVVADFGAERVLFASSAPYFDVRYEKRRVELLHVGPRERQALLGANATRIFSLPTQEVTVARDA